MMLGLYLYPIIMGRKSSNVLSLLNKLAFSKKLQDFVTQNVFWAKKVKTQQQQNKTSNIRNIAGAGN